jgi:phage tail sheath protein FI
MPEYLSPGVFIEEVPGRLKAIEGVSTSTAGLVGESHTGPVAGWTPPTITPGFVRPDESPVLVTSLSDYTRTFGPLPDDPVNNGYLGHSARAFFDNGGKRAFVARASRPGAAAAFHRIGQGAILRLTRSVRAGETTIFFNSLRGMDSTTPANLTFIGPDGVALPIANPFTVASFNTQAGSVTLTTAPGVVDASKAAVTSSLVTIGPNGPRFWARSPGAWGANLKVYVSNSDRPPVRVVTAIGAGSTTVQLQSSASFYIGALVLIDDGTGNRFPRTVMDILPGNTLRLDTAVANITVTGFAQLLEIDILISDASTGLFETYKGLCWNSDPNAVIRGRHYSTIINNRSTMVFVEPSWAGLGGALSDETPPTPNNQPMSAHGFPVGPNPALAAELGSDGPTPPDRTHIIGVDNGPGQRTGIQSLQDIDDIRIIAAPGETDISVQEALITQAEVMRYRFAVLDGEAAPPPPSVVNAILAHRNAYDSSYAAYYTPWVQVGSGDQTLLLPPSGYAIGIYARVDNDRGVWKAPANEVVRGATGLGSYITTGEQDLLNPRGVDAIRRFEGRGIRVWGARTLSSDPEFRYVNVRRFLIFLEASLDRGTQWVVFEPNSPETWSRVVDSVSAFLHTQWRSGALLGRKPEDAFFVRCDETTMSVDDIQNGRLICNIGVAIVRPAEFVIFRIEQIVGLGVTQ